jgi:tripartite ATP-independent transporter DctM subunit
MLTTLLLVFLVLLVAGVPVGFAMAVSALMALAAGGTIPLTIVPQTMAGALDSFPILAVPFFLLAGELMEHGGLTTRLLRFSGCLVGHLKGGLMHMSIFGSLIFSGVSGSAVADASAIGSVTIKAMIRKGYDAAYVAAVQAAAAAVGPIFPPSITMIVWSMTCSVGAMFLGGVVRADVCYLMIYNHYHWCVVRRRGACLAGSYRRACCRAPALVADPDLGRNRGRDLHRDRGGVCCVRLCVCRWEMDLSRPRVARP